MAQQAECADKRKDLYVIDNQIVFWAQEGLSCYDASYSYVLFGKNPQEILCRSADSIGGQQKSCENEDYREIFEDILNNLKEKDLGLGSLHSVQQISSITNTNSNINTNVNANVNANLNVNANTNANANTNSSTNINTSIDTKDWKTYENSVSNFLFKYPPEWIVLSDKLPSQPPILGSNQDEYLHIGVPGVEGLTEATAMLLYVSPAGWDIGLPDKEYTLGRKENNGFLVQSEETLSQTNNDFADPNTYSISAHEKTSSSSLFFYIWFAEDTKSKEGWDDTVKTILSTFQFTD
jgi:hypothetical protein